MKRIAPGLLSLLLVPLLTACPAKTPTPAADAGAPPGSEDAGPPDAGGVSTEECTQKCAVFGEICEGLVDLERCNAACEDATVGGSTGSCLTETNSCEIAATCTHAFHPAPSVPFNPGPYGTTPRSIAGPFTLQTTDGPWSFDQEWTGNDHYVFVVYYPNNSYSQSLFAGSAKSLLKTSPPNVHYFFLRAGASSGFDAFVQRSMDDLLQSDAATLQHWRTRLHFGAEDITKAEGWVGDLVRARTKAQADYKLYENFQWAIDRTQHVREVGMLGVLTNTGTAYDLSYLANEPKYYEFEFARQQQLDQENAVEVKLLDNQEIDDWEGPRNWRDAVAYPEVTLPDADTLAGCDTLEVDLSMQCLNHRDGDCGAWDYLANLYVCDDSAVDGGMDAGTGMDMDAGTTDAGEPTFKDPRPGCDREIARWITPYWREGRWVTDISEMLPYLKAGGQKTFRWVSKHQFSPREVPYVLSLSLRFSNRSKGMHPAEIHPLWTEGGAFDSTYASRHPPIQFEVPAGVKKVELVSFITGHGADTNSCSEFCNHTHHFRVNGKQDHSLTFPEAATNFGCAQKVDQGVVPNQSGTWYYGRGGWCPGWDVRPFIADVTQDLIPGTNEISYEALVGNSPPQDGKSYGSIALSSYLVYWR